MSQSNIRGGGRFGSGRSVGEPCLTRHTLGRLLPQNDPGLCQFRSHMRRTIYLTMNSQHSERPGVRKSGRPTSRALFHGPVAWGASRIYRCVPVRMLIHFLKPIYVKGLPLGGLHCSSPGVNFCVWGGWSRPESILNAPRLT